MLPSTTSIQVNDQTCEIDQIAKNLSTEPMIVQSYKVKTDKITPREVTSTRSSSSKDFIYIQTTDSLIILTHDHKVFSEGEWIRADRVTKELKLLNSSLDPISITDIHKIHNNTSQKVYNLTVQDTECFFANDILVHNHSTDGQS